MRTPSAIVALGRVLRVHSPSPIAKVMIDGEEPTSGMIALSPDNPGWYVLPGGEEASALHVTLKFLGKVDQWPNDKRDELNRKVLKIMLGFGPFDLRVSSVEMFGKEKDALVLTFDLPDELADMRQQISDASEFEDTWPDYKPHMTLMYDRGSGVPDIEYMVGQTIRFSRVLIAWATDRTDHLLIASPIEKGDFPGHPFRGNQWTGGGAVMFAADKGGGGGALRGTKPRRPVPAAMHQALDSEIEAFNAARKKENEKRKAFNAKLGKDGTGKKPLLGIIQAVWTDVHISDAPGGKPSKYVENGLLATGISTDGKPKYIYSEEHHAAARGSKFAQVAEVEKLIPKIDSALDSMVAKNSGPTADALALIRYMGFRVGGDGESLDRATGKKIKTFGATTLEARHVRISPAGNKVTFNFPSKGGYTQKHSSSDPTVVQAARNGLARTKKPSDRLFPDVTDSSTIELLRKVSGHPKLINHNLRTRLATVRARDWLADAMDEYDPPKTPAEKKAWLKEMASDISEVIGDTPDVTISTYIDPTVYEPILGSYK